ncbi:MAG: hypothetical protein RJA57_1320 [Bacteroidota bacterium]
MPKFLIIRLSSIGDIVLTTPVIRCLKQQVADAQVHFLVRDRFQSVVAHNPYIDRLHVWGHSREQLLEELRSESFDAVIDLHHNARTLFLKRALGVKAYSFSKLNLRKYLYTAFKVNTLPSVHIVDRYLDTVATYGVKNDSKGLDYFIAESEITRQEDIPASHHAGFIAAVIGAAHGTKRWPVHHWKRFCGGIRFPVILLGGAEDRERGEDIAAADPVKIYNACGKFSLNESADLVRKSRLVVTHDTGLMHIAAAFGRPIISLWGNTAPAFGMTPYYGDRPVSYGIMETKGLWCRPCSKIGYEKCPMGHFRCMERIDPEQVLRLVTAYL